MQGGRENADVATTTKSISPSAHRRRGRNRSRRCSRLQPARPGAADDPPYTLAREGFFYVGGKPTVVNGRTYVAGQMYVDVRIPAKQTQPYPIIMVHGGTRSATTLFGTPDGREGWAQYFVRQGYAVYVVDQPGRGRSGYLAESYGPWKVPDGDGGQRRLLSQARY